MTAARTAICLLPGLDGTGRLYRSLEAELQRDFDVLTLAYGANGYRYEDLVEELAPRLPHGRRFVLVAESFAGPLAILLAARRPPGLEALVLAASFARTPVRGGRNLAALIDRLPPLRPPRFLLERLLMGRHPNGDLAEALAGALAEVPLAVLRARAQSALRCDVSAELASLQLPLLYLTAQRDRLISRQAGEWIAQVYAGTERECVDAPHFLFQVAAEAAAGSIRSFLSRHPFAADAPRMPENKRI